MRRNYVVHVKYMHDLLQLCIHKWHSQQMLRSK